jgi:TRAP-type mannitol/chloroaromatic compound transport system permease small subunit
MNDSTQRERPTEKWWRKWTSFGHLIELMNGLGTGWIFVLLILVNTDIVGRTVFNKPVRGVAEIVGMTIVACVFLQLAHAIREDRLTRSEIILERLGKHQKFRRGLEAVYNLLGFFILTVLFVYSIPLFTTAWAIGEFVGAEGDFMAPVWPVKLITVIGSFFAALQCLFNCHRMIKEISAAKSPAKGGPT